MQTLGDKAATGSRSLCFCVADSEVFSATGDNGQAADVVCLAFFLRLDVLGFRGPIALVGYIQRDLVENRKWVSKGNYFEGLRLEARFFRVRYGFVRNASMC